EAVAICVTEEVIVLMDSPRASRRAATPAAWCSFDWWMPTAMTLMSMASTITIEGRMTANSAVTDPVVDFWVARIVSPDRWPGCCPGHHCGWVRRIVPVL